MKDDVATVLARLQKELDKRRVDAGQASLSSINTGWEDFYNGQVSAFNECMQLIRNNYLTSVKEV